MCEPTPTTLSHGDVRIGAPYRTLAREIRSNKRRPGIDVLHAMLAETLRWRSLLGAATSDARAGVEELVSVLQEVLGEDRITAAAGVVRAAERAGFSEEQEMTGTAACPVPLRRRLLETLSWRALSATEMAVLLRCPVHVAERLSMRLADEWLVLPLDDPDQGKRIYVLTLQGARWVDRHAAYGVSPSPPDGSPPQGLAGIADDRELPIAGQPLALIGQVGRWSVVPSYFAAVSAHLPPDTVESRATMALAASRWRNEHGFHRRAFILRSLAEGALAEALTEDPPPWTAKARRILAKNRWPPSGEAE